MTRLAGAVAGDAVVEDARRRGLERRHGGGDHETVEHDGKRSAPGFQDGARDRRKLTAAQLAQDLERRAILWQSPAGIVDDGDLRRPRRLVDAGSPARPLLGRTSKQGGGNRGCGCCVGDAHLAADEDVGSQTGNDLTSRLDAPEKARLVEGRLATQVGARSTDADVDDLEVGTDRTRHHRSRRRALAKGSKHLGGDGGRICTHSLVRHTVVGDEDHDGRSGDARTGCALPGRQPHRDIVQPGEGTGWPQDVRGPLTNRRRRRIVRRWHVLQESR